MIPKFTYNFGVASTLTFSLPQGWWEPEEGIGFGDEDESGAGIAFAYTVRYDRGVTVRLRFTDDEREAVLAVIEAAVKNKATSFTFQFDKDDLSTAFVVYLVTPRVGDKIQPQRDPGDPTIWELSITIRSVNGTRMNPPAFSS